MSYNMSHNVTAIFKAVNRLEESVASLDDSMSQAQQEANVFWLMFGAVLVFFMQTGFAMLEVGSVHPKNTRNILLKNVLDACLGAITWWWFGYGVAMGDSSGNGFIGSSHYGLGNDQFGKAGDYGYGYATWLFQWAFASATATIVSGAVAERCTFTAYLTYSICLTSFIYPCVACWGWNADGWASAWREDHLLSGCGLTDFAGSGVVHMTGGVAALCGASILGPRKDWKAERTAPYGPVFQALGVLILWFGWYGFNGASTLYITNYALVAAKTMVTTTISAACGGVTCLFAGFLLQPGRTIRLENAGNGVLAGLVGITAGCSVVEPTGAMIIGFVSAFVFLGSAAALDHFGVDDVVSAFPVHGACGFWGVLAASLFATEYNYGNAYYGARASKCAGLFFGGDGSLTAAALAFLFADIAWTASWSILIFSTLKALNLLRVDDSVEEAGMDVSEHGAPERQDKVPAAAVAPATSTRVVPVGEVLSS